MIKRDREREKIMRERKFSISPASPYYEILIRVKLAQILLLYAESD